MKLFGTEFQTDLTMTNRIPPLHPASPPPLHPATPPPLCRVEFYEDEVDENDDFGDFLTVTTDYEEKRQTKSLQENEDTKVNVPINELNSVEEIDVSTFSDNLRIDEHTTNETTNFSSLPDLPEIKQKAVDSFEEKSSDSENWSSQSNTDVTDNDKHIPESTAVSNNNNIREDVLSDKDDSDCSSAGAELHSVDQNRDHFTSRIENENDEHKKIVNNSSKFDCSTENHDKNAINTLASFTCIDDVSDTKLPFEPSGNIDLNTESGDDSSAIIDESAFVVEETKSNTDNDSFDDCFQDFTDYKSTNLHEKLDDLCFDRHSTCEEDKLYKFPAEATTTSVDQGNDIVFSSAFDEQISDANNAKEDLQFVTKDDWITIPAVTTECTHNPESSSFQPNFEEEPFEDDEFSDFVSPITYGESAVESNLASSDEVKSLPVDCATLPNFESNKTGAGSWPDVDVSECWNEIFQFNGDDSIEVNLNTIESRLNGSSVWCKMKNVETSPALNYNWQDSETNKMLLNTLSVDSRNILFGPRWNSEVPRFASNLGFSPLVPQKASDGSSESQSATPVVEELIVESSINESSPQVPATVNDAHFDWNDSGLTNPLDTRKSKKIKEVQVSELNSVHVDDSSSSSNGLSSEASDVLNNLPNLIVMEKQYIVFPIR